MVPGYKIVVIGNRWGCADDAGQPWSHWLATLIAAMT